MLILFDHGTPKGLIRALAGHDIITAQSRGWDKLDNGALLNAAENPELSFCSRPTEESAISKILRDENSLLLF
jgi:hypothetical protein